VRAELAGLMHHVKRAQPSILRITDYPTSRAASALFGLKFFQAFADSFLGARADFSKP